MTLPCPAPAGATGSWIDRVRAELRPEFDTDVILAAAGGSVFTGQPCRVPNCIRARVAHELCGSHLRAWGKDGNPPMESWAQTAPARVKGVRPLRPCDVVGCNRGRKEVGLCQSHLYRWKGDGRPDLVVWKAASAGPPLPTLALCPVSYCGLEGEGQAGLCVSHYSRWVANGRPPLPSYVEFCEHYGVDRFDLRYLPPVMRAEIAYGLQRRADERRTQTSPLQLRRLLKRLPDGVDSLTERTLEQWLAAMGWDGPRKHVARRFLVDTCEWLEDLADGVGWDVEYDRDVWRLRRLGFPTRNGTLRFDGIAPLWLRTLTKRWARWRLSTGISRSTVCHGVRAIVLLAETFPQLRRGPAALTREVIERHLANLAVSYPNAKGRSSHISSLASLLTTARQHRWEPRLLPTADIYREDYPRQTEPAPRFLSETVMAQLESPANLARFGEPEPKLLAQILMGTGLRVGDACRLALDCLVRDNHGAPYLRYRNHKMARDAVVPIGDDLASAVTEQQASVAARFPAAAHLVLRTMRNPDGRLHYSADTFRTRLRLWLADCDVRDELGRPVSVTPHQWRHTYATRLINADVPQEVVRRLLDHSTHHMTARYARLSDRTIRAKWEAARKVDIQGREIRPPEGELADAEWMKNNLARAKMALPNGYCALPLQQRCEYANACLTCPMFVTTAEFLPEHQRQLDATRQLIAQAEQNGQERLAEMNRTVERNLLAIIGGLEGGCCASHPSGSCPSCPTGGGPRAG